MKKSTLAIAALMTGGVFVAGVAVGKTTAKPTFTAAEEMKWDDLGGPKLANITGDYKKGAFSGLLKIPGGFTSPMHTHTGDYEAIMVSGTSSHWLEGEDGKSAKKMTPGSYWKMPGKLPHISACAAGADCVIYVWQKTKWDYKEVGAGSAAKPAGGSAAG